MEKKRKATMTWIITIICIIAAVAAIRTFVGGWIVVSGESMEATLQDGDNLLLDKLSYVISEPQRFDIVVFSDKNEKDVQYIKRVIGIPGDTLQIKNGYVYINGNKLQEGEFCSERISNPGTAENEIILGDDEYFVLGDNRNNSYDSRYSDVGVLKKDELIGKVFLCVYPISKIGLI